MTAPQPTLTVAAVVGAAHTAVMLPGAAGSALACASPALVVATWTSQLVAAQAEPVTVNEQSAAVGSENDEASCESHDPGSPRRSLPASGGDERDQLVQASVAGLVVDVAAPPVAVTPVSDGMEK